MIQSMDGISVVRPSYAHLGGATEGYHTERFFTLRRLEVQAGRTLAEAVADTGDQLLQIKEELAREGTKSWREWLAEQAAEAASRGVVPLDERRAREYIALAKFRISVGDRFALFLHLDPACLFPILSLPAAEVEKLAKEGVPTASGAAAPLETATRDEVRAAVASLTGKKRPAPTVPTRADRIAEIRKQIEALGPLSAEEQAQILETAGVKAEASEAPPILESGAAAPVAPVFNGLLGPVTLQGGRPVLGTLDRTALADEAIAAIEQVRQKCRAVPLGAGTLVVGRKKTAVDAAEALRRSILEWPAWR